MRFEYTKADVAAVTALLDFFPFLFLFCFVLNRPSSIRHLSFSFVFFRFFRFSSDIFSSILTSPLMAYSTARRAVDTQVWSCNVICCPHCLSSTICCCCCCCCRCRCGCHLDRNQFRRWISITILFFLPCLSLIDCLACNDD